MDAHRRFERFGWFGKFGIVEMVRHSGGDGTADSTDGYSVNTVHLHSSLMKFTYTVHALTQFLIKFTYTVHLCSSSTEFTCAIHLH